jgi:hypothetical protein
MTRNAFDPSALDALLDAVPARGSVPGPGLEPAGPPRTRTRGPARPSHSCSGSGRSSRGHGITRRGPGRRAGAAFGLRHHADLGSRAYADQGCGAASQTVLARRGARGFRLVARCSPGSRGSGRRRPRCCALTPRLAI